MKPLSTLALVLTFAAAGIQAREIPVRMTSSGSLTYLGPPDSLGPGTGLANDATSAGDGSLGPFTAHEVSAGRPTGPGCAGPNSLGVTYVAAAGVFRFQDGSLLTYKLKSGTSCIHFTKGSGSAIFTEEITGGTGRFKDASGTLTLTVPVSYPILFDATGQQPVLIVIGPSEVIETIVLPE